MRAAYDAPVNEIEPWKDAARGPRLQKVLAAAGIGAQGLARFFERLAETRGGMPAALQLLSTHPSHDARARLFAEAAGQGGAAMSEADWAALQGICGG